MGVAGAVGVLPSMLLSLSGLLAAGAAFFHHGHLRCHKACGRSGAVGFGAGTMWDAAISTRDSSVGNNGEYIMMLSSDQVLLLSPPVPSPWLLLPRLSRILQTLSDSLPSAFMTVGLDNFAMSFLSLMGTAPGGGMGRPSASRAGGVGFGKVRGLRGVGEGSASINERIFSARVIGSSSSSSPTAASGVFSGPFRPLASCFRRSKGRTFSTFAEYQERILKE